MTKEVSLQPFLLSLRAERGNLGGAWDCFGTVVPRNDKEENPRNDKEENPRNDK